METAPTASPAIGFELPPQGNQNDLRNATPLQPTGRFMDCASRTVRIPASPQRQPSSHTLDEIRARLKPRNATIGNFNGGALLAGIAAHAALSESLRSPSTIRKQCLPGDIAIARSTGIPSASAADCTTQRSAGSLQDVSSVCMGNRGPPALHRFASFDSILRRHPQADNTEETAVAIPNTSISAVSTPSTTAPDVLLDTADMKGLTSNADCLIMVQELLAFVDALEEHRQHALQEAGRLRQYNCELAMMLQQANSREQQVFSELQTQRTLLNNTNIAITDLQAQTEDATSTLCRQRDLLLARLEEAEQALDRFATENGNLIREKASYEGSLAELESMRQSHGNIEREKRQLQSELEDRNIANSRLLNERMELQGQLHRLQSSLIETQAEGFQHCHLRRLSREIRGVSPDVYQDPSGCADIEKLLEQLLRDAGGLGEAQQAEALRTGAGRRILEAFSHAREEKQEYHGYAVELLNRLDALKTPAAGVCLDNSSSEDHPSGTSVGSGHCGESIVFAGGQ